jgi:hypothetical protein
MMELISYGVTGLRRIRGPFLLKSSRNSKARVKRTRAGNFKLRIPIRYEVGKEPHMDKVDQKISFAMQVFLLRISRLLSSPRR